MLSLFKKQNTSKSLTKGYPQVVKDIHNQFNVAGDRLLKEAESILASIRIDNKGKIDDLKQFGFRQTKEVVETGKKIEEREQSEAVANLLSELKVKYPQYKFITIKEALTICEKYDLVIGDVGQFKGFVPEKNLSQIKAFFSTDTELNTRYYCSGYFGRGGYITVEQYEHMIQAEQLKRETTRHNSSTEYLYGLSLVSGYREENRPCKSKQNLFIAAPIKDMDTKGHKLMGRVLRKEVPDPVVLCPYTKNGIELYCIVTAWGDEASDPIVVNEKMN